MSERDGFSSDEGVLIGEFMIAALPRPERTWWSIKKLTSMKGMDGRKQERSLQDAHLISSLCKNGKHAPVLDLDFPCEFRNPFMMICRVPEFQILRNGPWSGLGDFLKHLGITELLELVVPDPFRDAFETCAEIRFKVLCPMRLRISSSHDHRHLYIDQEIPWSDYQILLELLRDCGLIEVGFCNASIMREMTMVLKPGLTKDMLEGLGIEVESSAKKPEKG